MHGTEPQEVEGVRCGSCGANTPVADVSDPHCAYCGRAVAVPPEVRARAGEVERAIESAREDVDRTRWKLLPEAPGFTAFITFYQTVFVFTALYFWHRQLPQGATISLEQWGLIALALIGPALFWNMARDRGIDKKIARVAKLSFAKLVVERSATGMKLYLRCSSCGARMEHAKLHGLTIFCNHCRAAMLAPSELVDRNLQHFYQRVLGLRGQLERRIDTRGLLTNIASMLYFFLPFAHHFLFEGDEDTVLLGGMALATWCVWVYWLMVVSQSDYRWWVAFMMLALLLGPSGALLLQLFDSR